MNYTNYSNLKIAGLKYVETHYPNFQHQSLLKHFTFKIPEYPGYSFAASLDWNNNISIDVFTEESRYTTNKRIEIEFDNTY